MATKIALCQSQQDFHDFAYDWARKPRLEAGQFAPGVGWIFYPTARDEASKREWQGWGIGACVWCSSTFTLEGWSHRY